MWYGSIRSENRLVKSANRRDLLKDLLEEVVIGLEMEAASIMNRIPVGVI